MLLTGEYSVTIIETIWPLVLVAVVTTIWFLYRTQIRESKASMIIPFVLLGFILLFEFPMVLFTITAPFRSWSITVEKLPLHLCSVSAILVMVYWITRKETVMQFLFLPGIIGAILTFLFPDIEDGPNTYYYYKFFLSHAVLILTPIYALVILKFKVTKKTLLYSLGISFVFGNIAIIFNEIWGTHYFYISSDNTTNLYAMLPLNSMLPFLSNWPWIYFVGLVLLVGVYSAVYYIITKLQKYID